MAYEPTQWRSGDTITSERLNKMEQGIAGGGSGEFYALHTTVTRNEDDTSIFSSVELREDGLPIILVVEKESSDMTEVMMLLLVKYDDPSVHDAAFLYKVPNNSEIKLQVNRQTGEVSIPVTEQN